MKIYSGKCAMGVVGEATPLVDERGIPLFVGDIVASYTVDRFGVSALHSLSAVVSDRFTTYSDGTHVEKDSDPVYFVMGIKGVDFMNSEEWFVLRLKSHSDVIDGERWPDYGFNYKDEERKERGDG